MLISNVASLYLNWRSDRLIGENKMLSKLFLLRLLETLLSASLLKQISLDEPFSHIPLLFDRAWKFGGPYCQWQWKTLTHPDTITSKVSPRLSHLQP